MVKTFKDNMIEFFGTLALTPVAALMFMPLYLLIAWYRAWAGNILWGWFITPIFGMASPGIWPLAGLMLCLFYVQHTPSSKTDPKKLAVDILGPFLFLLAGVGLKWFGGF